MAARERTSERIESEQPSAHAVEEEELEVDDGPGESAVEELDAETRARRDAALAHIRKLGDPVLRANALEVERFDEALRSEVERMGQLMSDALGVGLAATQVGVLHRVLVYRADPDEPLTALVNPVIEWRSEELAAAEEGCLSIPGIHVEVERPARVRARARDVSGGELEIEAAGLEARVIQHEVDHLDGILILDRISREARREAMRELREIREGRTPERAAERADSGDAAAA
ncbi:MAG TPA: peptide deformylase [Solirubrobacteraceae bacterium]|nr:peptide deformylase [Solirubrobacteraceae bacterium]